jgi:signal transduction histidine kinase
MEQVFVNLLNNAFGHNPPGTRVHVTASAEPAAPEVVVSVQDDGRGMPPELVAAPFEPARRLRASNGSGHPASNGNGNSASSRSNGGNRKSAGAGLGLSIAKGIVQAHGGRIELSPVTPVIPVIPVTPLRQGTCFSVYLPVEAEVLDGSRLTGPRATRGPADLGVTGDFGVTGDLGVAAKGGHTSWESKE